MLRRSPSWPIWAPRLQEGSATTVAPEGTRTPSPSLRNRLKGVRRQPPPTTNNHVINPATVTFTSPMANGHTIRCSTPLPSNPVMFTDHSFSRGVHVITSPRIVPWSPSNTTPLSLSPPSRATAVAASSAPASPAASAVASAVNRYLVLALTSDATQPRKPTLNQFYHLTKPAAVIARSNAPTPPPHHTNSNYFQTTLRNTLLLILFFIFVI